MQMRLEEGDTPHHRENYAKIGKIFGIYYNNCVVLRRAISFSQEKNYLKGRGGICYSVVLEISGVCVIKVPNSIIAKFNKAGKTRT